MTATIHKLARTAARIACTSCGASTEAPCDCGVPLEPVAVRVAERIAKKPETSDRGIARELGVSHEAVSKVRRAAGVNSLTPDAKRIGLDGKSYPAKPKKAATVLTEDEDEIQELTEQERLQQGFGACLSFGWDSAADAKMIIGRGCVPSREQAKQARAVADAWLKLSQQLERDL